MPSRLLDMKKKSLGKTPQQLKCKTRNHEVRFPFPILPTICWWTWGNPFHPASPSAGPCASFFSLGCNVSSGFSPEAHETRRPSSQRIPRCTNKKHICLWRVFTKAKSKRDSRSDSQVTAKPAQPKTSPTKRSCGGDASWALPHPEPLLAGTRIPVLVALPGFSHTNPSQLSTGNAKLPCSKG